MGFVIACQPMQSSELPSTYCYSMRVVRPWVKLLRRYESIAAALLDDLDALDDDERVPIAAMEELNRGALLLTQDAELGLKAAREIEAGDYGALEYAASSAATMREALEIVVRYVRVVNDALSVTLEVEADRATVCLHSAFALSRANREFQSAAFYIALTAHPLVGAQPSYEVWFTHPEPAQLGEHAKTFPGVPVRFGMPADAFVFEAAALSRPLENSNTKLHSVIRKHVELVFAELPRAQRFTEEVRARLMRELSGGVPSAEELAKSMHLSPRTLRRRLEAEGTSFKELLEALRKHQSVRYVSGHELDISEIAFLLGFADITSFYRAFKRWTGQTPLAYRRAQHG